MRLLVCLQFVLLIGCNGAPPAQAEGPVGGEQPAAEQPEAGTDQEATGGDDEATGLTSKLTTNFDADRAWDHLIHQVNLGFRVPGTSVHRTCRRWLESELGKYCEQVYLQEFERVLPPDHKSVKMWNVIGRINPEAERRILLVAHWDTRPTADYNPPGQQDQPIAGANDGASGVAVLLELARVFSEVPPPVGIDILLTDGEDYGPGSTTMFMGAEHFAASLGISQVRAYNYGILLDMIGDKQLDIHPEHHSEGNSGRIYAVAFEVSRALGYLAFKEGGGYRITDDHIALLERGIKIYDFIDFNYDYWHTTEDTADKCSRDSLEAVGRTVENMIYLFPEIYSPDDKGTSRRNPR